MKSERITPDSHGKIVYNESIVKGIVAIAVESIEGVKIKSDKNGKSSIKDSIRVISEKNGIYVSVSVGILYGYSVPDVSYNIQHEIRQNVESMSKYKISKVDVFITDVLFDGEPNEN